MKELFELIKMLFSSNPKDCDELTFMGMKHFPFKSFKLMMWCGRIIYRQGNEELIKRFFNTEIGKTDKRHETLHLKEAQEIGSWILYYLIYLYEWLKGIPFIKPFESAYYTIPFEVEAYALEHIEGSEINYDTSLLKNKYTLKHRKKIYKENEKNWKEFVKSL